MKKIIFSLCCLLVSSGLVFSQTAYQPEGLVKVDEGNITFDLGSVVIKDNEGKQVDNGIFLQIASSKNSKYNLEFYGDGNGVVKEVVLRLKPADELAAEMEINGVHPLTDELEHIHMKDQFLRSLIVPGGCIHDTYDRDSDQYRYFSVLMQQEDAVNQKRVCEIIDQYGWLGISEVGERANSALFLVIQHAPLEIQEKYFPLLKQSAEKGESRMANMALMDDRIRMYNKQKQLYGSQAMWIEGKTYVVPIEDPENVDERRKIAGLEPLADYLKRLDLKYPEDEMPMDLFLKK